MSELDLHIFKDRKSIYDDVVAPRNDKHGSYITLDGVVQCQLKQCPHCGGHWPYRKGSGAIRHFCPKCMQSTCGKPQCHPDRCEPWEAKMLKIEQAEARRREVESWLG